MKEEKEASLQELRRSFEEEREALRTEMSAQIEAKDSTIQESNQKSESQQETEVSA